MALRFRHDGDAEGRHHRHARLAAVCETYARHVLAARPEDRFFLLANLFFAYGLGNSLLFPLSVGATAVLEPRGPTHEVVLERMRADRPTLLITRCPGMLAADLPREASPWSGWPRPPGREQLRQPTR